VSSPKCTVDYRRRRRRDDDDDDRTTRTRVAGSPSTRRETRVLPEAPERRGATSRRRLHARSKHLSSSLSLSLSLSSAMVQAVIPGTRWQSHLQMQQRTVPDAATSADKSLSSEWKFRKRDGSATRYHRSFAERDRERILYSCTRDAIEQSRPVHIIRLYYNIFI